MARTALTPITAPGSVDPAAAVSTPAAGDAVNGNEWLFRRGDILHAYNSGGAEFDVTLKGASDSQNRSADSVQAVPVGDVATFGPLDVDGWQQANGMANVDVEDAALVVWIISGA